MNSNKSDKPEDKETSKPESLEDDIKGLVGPRYNALFNIVKSVVKLAGLKAFLFGVIGFIAGAAAGLYSYSNYNHLLPFLNIDNIETDIYQEYEWQWAGENWYGRVTLANENNKDVVRLARVFQIIKQYKPENPNEFWFELKKDSVLIDLVDGEFTRKDRDVISVDLEVKKKTRSWNQPLRHRISGDLKLIPCFAGKLKYENLTNEEDTFFLGDMILVAYKSMTGEEIENLFIPEANPEFK